MSLFIGIDSGTQSTKGVVLDLDTKTIVGGERAPRTRSSPACPPGIWSNIRKTGPQHSTP